jgi:ribosomal protein S18 acetylase RimI-like enzyme
MPQIHYEVNGDLTPQDFIDILNNSTLGKRRPVDDMECIEGMIKNADLTVCVKANGKIIGVARSVTDFTYCCYLSDLAVHKDYQHLGIGRELIRATRDQLGKRCILILLSAPAAVEYYPKIGFKRHNQAWILYPEDELK